MSEIKRYYWIKIRDTFLTSDTVDYLMSQKNGSDFVVLYQMLCLKTINTDGLLARKIGEVLIPLDADKLHRDFKWFSLGTVKTALRLFRELGLIEDRGDGAFQISGFQEMVGSETSYAKSKRRQRGQKQDTNETMSETMSTQRLEIRD